MRPSILGSAFAQVFCWDLKPLLGILGSGRVEIGPEIGWLGGRGGTSEGEGGGGSGSKNNNMAGVEIEITDLQRP